jgi:hypothetical protein
LWRTREKHTGTMTSYIKIRKLCKNTNTFIFLVCSKICIIKTT